MRKPVVVLLAVLSLLLAACTGVPSSSRPRTVESIDIDNNVEPPQPGPTPGADPRSIVSAFLDANAVDPSGHDTAREYLAGVSKRQWSDTTATIISGRAVGNEVNGVVTVRGQLVGSLSQNGVYTPQLAGTGSGGGQETFTYRMTTVRGQSRIADLPSGLVLTTDQFRQYYRQHALYFFDQAHRYLVPDLRWTALESNRLTAWLVEQLASGPRPELAGTVATDTLPAQANSRRVSVSNGNPIKIEIPGASQLDGRGKRELAAQISATVTDPQAETSIQLTDGGNAVPMPDSDTTFTATQAAYQYTPTPPAPDVFYLRDGKSVVQGDGTVLGGKLRANPYYLNSIAVSQPEGTAGFTVAAVSGSDRNSRLLLGTESDGYRPTTVRGSMSRPSWAPGAPPGSSAPSEVWVGVGGLVVRVLVSGGRATSVTQVSNNANAAGGRIVALRLSPEGSRIALVIRSANTSRLYIGSIVRGAGQVRIDSLPSISPDGVSIEDVGWIGSQKLIAIGSQGDEARLFETNVDGSYWSGRPVNPDSILPGPPDSLAVAVSQLAWVSSNGTIWKQSAREWASPQTNRQVSGTKPVYLE